jgi:hypothetical protein
MLFLKIHHVFIEESQAKQRCYLISLVVTHVKKQGNNQLKID